MVYNFRIHLEDKRSGRNHFINFTSVANSYLDAWKEATEEAWAELNMHDVYWYIKRIDHEI